MAWFSGIYVLLAIGLIVFSSFLVRRVRAQQSSEERLSLTDYVAVISIPLNMILLVVALVTLHVAITTYEDAKRTGEEQTKMAQGSLDALHQVSSGLKAQERTLEGARVALDSSVQVAASQHQLLAKEVANSKKQLDIIQAEWARELEQADIHAALYYPEHPAIVVYNTSKIKPVRDGLYQLIMFNIDRPVSEKFQLVQTVATATTTIPPSFAFLPSNLNFLLQPADEIAKGNRLFGYLSISCAECATPRIYWVLLKYGEDGWYREGKIGDPAIFYQLNRSNIDAYVTDFLSQKDLVRVPSSLISSPKS